MHFYSGFFFINHYLSHLVHCEAAKYLCKAESAWTRNKWLNTNVKQVNHFGWSLRVFLYGISHKFQFVDDNFVHE